MSKKYIISEEELLKFAMYFVGTSNKKMAKEMIDTHFLKTKTPIPIDKNSIEPSTAGVAKPFSHCAGGGIDKNSITIAEGEVSYDGESWVLVPIKCSKTMGGLEYSKFYKKLDGKKVKLILEVEE